MFCNDELIHLLDQQTKIWGLILTDEQKTFFTIFCQNFMRFSKIFSLTSSCDQDLWEKHFFDSLRLLPYLLDREVRDILDIGSGGGFPGICLAIMLPYIRFTLCESNTKKAGFLLSTIHLMGIKNVKVLCCSYQEIKERFDLCVSRAMLRIVPKNIKKILRFAPIIVCYKGKIYNVEHDRRKLKAAGISTYIDVLDQSSLSLTRTFLWIRKI